MTYEQPFLRVLQQLSMKIDVSRAFVENTCLRLLDVFVDQPLLPSQFTLETLGYWDANGNWNRPFTSHPKRAPDTGELVIMGVDATKPFMELGVVSADGKRLLHKADLKFNRCSLSHDIRVTKRYNVVMDFPLTIDINRLLKGGHLPVLHMLIKHNKAEYARIGIMPRFGNADSINWFQQGGQSEELIQVEYHKVEQNTFCTGAAFVPKQGSHEEDDGWIITFLHNEDTSMSKAYIIDTKKFTSEPVAKITLPCRVPYGFHGAFMPILLQSLTAS
uniref:Carotenoid oxygenase n=1 Tax=Salix viminalis TaxID=40686 RepID=A0A6N2NLS6_SALVM